MEKSLHQKQLGVKIAYFNKYDLSSSFYETINF
jgi:hypothetical protein